MIENEAELVLHTATMCRGEPVVNALAKELNTTYYAVVLSWMQEVASLGLFLSRNAEHIRENVERRVPLERDQVALLFGLSLLYSVDPTCGEDHSFDKGDYAKDIGWDPLGIRELFVDTHAPCLGQ